MLSKSSLLYFGIVTLAFLVETEAWWLVGENGNDHQCPRRGGASPYYFGSTSLSCLTSSKRGVPSRGIWELTHRFIYYKEFYFDFHSDSYATIARLRYGGKCSGSTESSPAGYSYLSADCIKGCARNYRCKFGTYNALSNNCHKFANRLSEVLCTSGHTCPSWCLGSCNYARVI
ncbi:uncharacterized protein LOC144619359 [Crassostrea virginica]